MKITALIIAGLSGLGLVLAGFLSQHDWILTLGTGLFCGAILVILLAAINKDDSECIHEPFKEDIW